MTVPTPTRDEAVYVNSVARNKALKVYTAACSTHSNRVAFDMAIREYLIASAPAPASGDVVREALEAAFEFLGGVDGASEVRDKLLTALQSTAGRVGE